MTYGTGRPGVNLAALDGSGERGFSPDYLLAPAGSLTLQDELSFLHRINLMIPLE